jgi:hypothetical protein
MAHSATDAKTKHVNMAANAGYNISSTHIHLGNTKKTSASIQHAFISIQKNRYKAMAGATHDARTLLSYEAYSAGLREALKEALLEVRESVEKMNGWISENRAYTAPELTNDAKDKRQLYDTFCDVDSEIDTQDETVWRVAAGKFFEEYK